MGMPDEKKGQINLNSILTLLFGGGLSMLVTFTWNSVTKTNESVVRIETTQIQMQRVLAEVTPKSELEIRFKNMESQLLEIKVRQQSTDVELMKLRESMRQPH